MTRHTILFEDGEALVIDKPAGLPLDPPRAGGPSLEDDLQALALNFQRPPFPVHRLDRDTSGCLLLARNPKALKRFSAAFEARTVDKVYLGIVDGVVAEEQGTIELALSKVSTVKDGWRMIPARKGKPAVTHWRKLAEHEGRTLVEFRPETGRTHQIRVHAASGLGAPLLGDPVYGANPAGDKLGSGDPGNENLFGSAKPSRNPDAPRTMLHAWTLTVPRDGKPPVTAVSPFPADFAAAGFAAPVLHVPGDEATPEADG
jgi:tRNA pseudouridine32 synthase/23S rRNA pseudouridine746 synthase